MINEKSPLFDDKIPKYLNKNQIEIYQYKNLMELSQKLSKLEKVYAIVVPENIEMLEYIKGYNKEIPAIVLCDKCQQETAEEIFAKGAYDYLAYDDASKNIIQYRIKNAVMHYKMLKELMDRENRIILISNEARENFKKIDELNRRLLEKNKILEVLVEARTKELQDMTNSLISALESANLYNDEDTGIHLERVSEYSMVLAEEAGLAKRFVKEIKIYSPLHDIGKVGIPDAILKKPGKYTDDEFEAMKNHVLIGYNMVKDSSISNVAKNIIRYHHEKWDGRGYVDGLKGEEIPIEARIVAIADVFDALTTERSYKPAFDMEKTLRIMNEGRGRHFDPNLIEIFNRSLKRILSIKQRCKENIYQ